jgi:hypothetical protein
MIVAGQIGCGVGATEPIGSCQIARVAGIELTMADASAVRPQHVPPLQLDQAVRLTVDAVLADFALDGSVQPRTAAERLAIYQRFVRETFADLDEKTPQRKADALKTRLEHARQQAALERGPCFPPPPSPDPRRT